MIRINENYVNRFRQWTKTNGGCHIEYYHQDPCKRTHCFFGGADDKHCVEISEREVYQLGDDHAFHKLMQKVNNELSIRVRFNGLPPHFKRLESEFDIISLEESLLIGEERVVLPDEIMFGEYEEEEIVQFIYDRM